VKIAAAERKRHELDLVVSAVLPTIPFVLAAGLALA
jgi:hypothetical protein